MGRHEIDGWPPAGGHLGGRWAHARGVVAAVAIAALVLAVAAPRTQRGGRPALRQLAVRGVLGWPVRGQLAGCAAGVPQVAFPSDAPRAPTGPGAIVWLSPSGGCGSDAREPGAGAGSLSVAPLDADDRPGSVEVQSLAPAPNLAGATGASLGRVAALIPSGKVGLSVLQGRATRTLLPTAGIGARAGAVALARAYLGDVAVAVVEPNRTIAVYVERHYRAGFDPPVRVAVGPGRVTSLTATMDYRADVLLAWQQNGAVYAHMLRQSMRAEPTQRVGPSAPDPQLAAVVSDNDHGMVAWSSTAPTRRTVGVPVTHVRLALSSAGVRFGGYRALASFGDPARAAATPGSLALVRLSTENVLLAWTEATGGHTVVRAAPAVFAGVRPSLLVSGASGEGVLSALAAGPAGEAVATWRGSQELGAGVQALWATRVFIGRHDRPGVRAPEAIAPAGTGVANGLAVDPATDRPVAAWTSAGAHGVLEYASGPGAGGYRPHPVPEPPLASGTSVHWLRITAAALAVIVLLLLGWAIRRRRMRRRLVG
jgi:hypothetical protein